MKRPGTGESGKGKKKKRPRLFSLGRLGSPPPELPTTRWILGFPQSGVNVTLVMRWVAQIKENRGVSKTEGKLLFLPGLAGIIGHPYRCIGCNHFDMLLVGKFNADNIAAKNGTA
jgi:hypothetical protein